ncbi:MAG: beta-lactamase family protein [Clostridia bacterium]|nr:beta-lactamase family protein [Clostridia bacterium]
MKTLNTDKLHKNIEKIANYDLENNHIFGASYCVIQKDKLISKKHFGFSDADGKTHVTDKTLYRIASMSKPIAGVAMMILEQHGHISVDDPVKKYLPELADIQIVSANGKTKPKTDLTIAHCLSHTSGFGSTDETDMTDKDRETIASTIKYWTNKGLIFEPFTQSMYSAYGAFDVLGAIVEKVTDMDYGTFLKKEIFLPCKMTNTTFSPTAEQQKRIMTMHDKADNKSVISPTVPGCVFENFPYSHNLVGAGLVSSLSDYMNFAKMLLNHGKFGNTQILSKNSVIKLSTPCFPISWAPDKESWGLSVRVVTSDSYERLPVGSYGWSGAYGSHFWIDPENEICAVYMKNSRFIEGNENMSARRFETVVSECLM